MKLNFKNTLLRFLMLFVVAVLSTVITTSCKAKDDKKDKSTDADSKDDKKTVTKELCSDLKEGYKITFKDDKYAKAFTLGDLKKSDNVYNLDVSLKVSALTNANGFVSNHVWVSDDLATEGTTLLAADNKYDGAKGSVKLAKVATDEAKLRTAFAFIDDGEAPLSQVSALAPNADGLLDIASGQVKDRVLDSAKGFAAVTLSATKAGVPGNNGWQEVFSVKPCDSEIKNGFIAAQLIGVGEGTDKKKQDGTMTEAKKFNHLGNAAGKEDTIKVTAAGAKLYVDSYVGSDFTEDDKFGLFTVSHSIDGTDEKKIATATTAMNAKLTRGALVCRSIITDLGTDAAAKIVGVDAATNTVDKPLKGGAGELKCYLGLTALWPTIMDKALETIHNTQFAKDTRGEVVQKYDTGTKEIALLMVGTGDVKAKDKVIKDVFTLGADVATEFKSTDDNNKKMDALLEKDGVKYFFGKIKLNFEK